MESLKELVALYVGIFVLTGFGFMVAPEFVEWINFDYYAGVCIGVAGVIAWQISEKNSS